MILAKGTYTWILFSFIVSMFFLALFLIFSNLISNIFLFIFVIFSLLTIFLIIFFRDPNRTIGNGIVAPADGRIQSIRKSIEKDIEECIIISTFMNIYNVHVNRMPIDGIIKNMIHVSGSHLPAFKKESERNERLIITIESKIGTIKIIQIAGTLARRIVPYIKIGDVIKRGEKIGIIRLGSRVDLYISSKMIKNITVKLGDKIKAGENCIAEIHD